MVLYLYMFDAGPNKHDILIGLSLPRKSQHILLHVLARMKRGTVLVKCDYDLFGGPKDTYT